MAIARNLAATRTGLMLVLGGVVIIFASTLPNVILDIPAVGDFLDLAGTVLSAVGACLIIRALSSSRRVHWCIYAASAFLVIARIADFTQEFEAISHLPFFGGEGFARGGFTHITGMIGYVFILVTVLSVLFEMALLREEAEVEHARFRELHDSSILLAQIVDMAGDAVIGVDRSGIIRTWNQGAVQLFGYESGEMQGKPLLELVSFTEADAPSSIDALITAVHVEPLSNVEMVAHRNGGDSFLAAATLSLVKDEFGNDAGVSVIVRDIEEQKEAERKLLTNRNILAGALKHAEVGAFIAGRDDSVIEFNDRMEGLTGYLKHDIESLRDFGLRVCDPRARVVETIVSDVFRRGQAADFRNLLIYHRDGSERVCNLSVTPVRDETGRVVAAAGIAVDLTERELLQTRLMQAQKMESIGRLAGGIAHDFNNILGGILGYASLLVETLPEESDHQRYARAIEDSAARAAGLTKQLLAFAKGNERHIEKVSMNQVVDETLKLIGGVVKPNVRFSIEQQADLDTIEADPSQMHQVVLNLCINARDAVDDDGHIVVRTENITADSALSLRLRLDQAADYVRLSVEDNGCGMPPDVVQRAYEPFFSTKPQGQGFGLGMSVVYGIVNAHGGTIHVETAEGEGTRVEVYFPSAGPAGIIEPKPQSSGLARARGSETILIVDDEQLIRALVQDVFGGAGYNVLEASSGEEALDVLDQHGRDIDLVILDLIMPGMGGAAALKQLHARHPDARVIISSGYGSDSADLDGLDARRIRFVQKPYQASALVVQARELIDN